MTLKNCLLILSSSMLLLSSCVNIADNSGEGAYKKHCSSCHGQNGEGLGSYIPPLRDADYLKENEDQLACIIKYGLSGELEVNGITYNQPMGGISELDEAELTNLINYLRKEFLSKSEPLSVMQVSNQTAKCD